MPCHFYICFSQVWKGLRPVESRKTDCGNKTLKSCSWETYFWCLKITLSPELKYQIKRKKRLNLSIICYVYITMSCLWCHIQIRNKQVNRVFTSLSIWRRRRTLGYSTLLHSLKKSLSSDTLIWALVGFTWLLNLHCIMVQSSLHWPHHFLYKANAQTGKEL